MQCVAVVNEAYARFPRELDDSIAVECYAFGKVCVAEPVSLEDLCCFERCFSQLGLAVSACAFVEETVGEDEALGEGGRVVWEGVDDAVGINRCCVWVGR